MQRDEPGSIGPLSPFVGTGHPPSFAPILTRLGLEEAGEFARLSPEQVVRLLGDQHWQKRASAATALGAMGKNAPVNALIGALDDEAEEVRAAALRALGRVRNVATVSAVVIALRDPQTIVREAAATTLGRLGDRSSSGPLSLALLDEAEEVRAAAAQALGRVGDGKAVSLLEIVLQDPHPEVREAAIGGLGELGDPSARKALLALVQDDDPLVREAVAQALLLLEQPISQEMIHLLFQEKDLSTQQVARGAVSLLADLGLSIQEEQGCIAPLVVALQSANKEIEKVVMCYLIGRALDVLHERLSLQPLLNALRQERQPAAIEEGIWRMVSSLAQEAVQERKMLRLLVAAANDLDQRVREAIDEAVKWLLELSLTLQEERGLAEEVQAALKDKTHPSRRVVICQLIKQAFDALEEREPVEYYLRGLYEIDAERRIEVGRKLAKRARKALLGRMPGGPLVISLKDASEVMPLELQFGSDQEAEMITKEGRYVFPWSGPPQLNLPSLPDQPRSAALGLTVGNLCFQ